MQKAKLWAMVLAVGLMLVFTLACASGRERPASRQGDPEKLALRPPGNYPGRQGAQGLGRQRPKRSKGALRQDPKEIKTWAANLPKDKKIVLYCA